MALLTKTNHSEERLILLKFKKSTPGCPFSTPFEQIDECTQSMVLMGKDWNVLAKCTPNSREKVERLIKENNLEKIVDIIEAKVLRYQPIEHLINKKNLLLSVVPVKRNSINTVREFLLEHSNALQIFESKGYYSFWLIFSFDMVSDFVSFQIEIRERCPNAIKRDNDLGIVITKFRKSEAGPSIPLLEELKTTISKTRGKKYYLTPCIDVLLSAFQEDVWPNKLVGKQKDSKIKYSKKTFQKYLQKLHLRGVLRKLKQKGRRENVYTLNGDNFPQLYSYFRREFP